MTRLFSTVLALVMLTTSVRAQSGDEPATHAKIQTSTGDIVVALNADKAPMTVANFLEYARAGHYDRTIFHRVVHDYVIQAGGFSQYFNERPLRDAIAYEGDNGLLNQRGTIAMARGDNEDSAQAQWFINLRDNSELDHGVTEFGPVYGYAVFGEIVAGMEIADEIGSVSTADGGPFDAEVPLDPVLVLRVDPIAWPADK